MPDVIGAAQELDVRLIAAVPRGGTPLPDLDLRRPTAIVLGGEGSGLPPAAMSAMDETVTIPMRKSVESLNVAIAASLLLYEATRQRQSLMDLFDNDPPPPRERDAPAAVDPSAPLAERMRPRTLDDIVGQDGLLAPGRPLREAIARDRLRSIILWGPPGTGKTTLARVIANATKAHFIAFSAVMSGIKEIREVMAEAEQARRRSGSRTILFIDEIHRFNKAQQDAFLPRVESGDIVLIGATTENPSFEVNSALLSRSKVHVLKPLTMAAMVTILKRAIADTERGLGSQGATASDEALTGIARYANGDARTALNMLEMAAATLPEQSRGARAARRSTSRWSPTWRRTARCSTTRPARSTTT